MQNANASAPPYQAGSQLWNLYPLRRQCYALAPRAFNCEYSSLCAEVANSADVFDQYVGHDEPSVLFYSNKPGSGHRVHGDAVLPAGPHPQPILFSSPLTGPGDSVNDQRVGFEADVPRIEGTCDRSTGAGCTLIPTTDSGAPAAFYPYYSAFQGTRGGAPHGCLWGLSLSPGSAPQPLPGGVSGVSRSAPVALRTYQDHR